MNLIDLLYSDELLEKWFRYMYTFETGLICDDINIMISDLRNRGIPDDVIVSLSKSTYPRHRFFG